MHLHAELLALVGGGLRGRYTLTNSGSGAYSLEGLEVVLPLPDHLSEEEKQQLAAVSAAHPQQPRAELRW